MRPDAVPGVREVSGRGLRDFFSDSTTDRYAASQASLLVVQKSILKQRAPHPSCLDLSIPGKPVPSIPSFGPIHKGDPVCAKDSMHFAYAPGRLAYHPLREGRRPGSGRTLRIDKEC